MSAKPEYNRAKGKFRAEDKRLLEPGWAGVLADEELDYIQQALLADPALSRLWGFRLSMQTRSADAIRRIAMSGDAENERHNRGLARPRRSSP